MSRIIFGVIILVLGLSALIGISFFQFIFAILFIIWGISILSGRTRRWDWGKEILSHQDAIDEVAILSELNLNIESENFHGGKIVMVLSGGEIDMSNIKSTEKNIHLEIVSVLSGCTLIIPKNARAHVQGTAILGGYDNRVQHNNDENAPKFTITGSTILGGIEIRSK